MEERIERDEIEITVSKADLIDMVQRSLTGISEIVRVLEYYNKIVPKDILERKERYMKLFSQLTHLGKEPEDAQTTD